MRRKKKKTEADESTKRKRDRGRKREYYVEQTRHVSHWCGGEWFVLMLYPTCISVYFICSIVFSSFFFLFLRLSLAAAAVHDDGDSSLEANFSHIFIRVFNFVHINCTDIQSHTNKRRVHTPITSSTTQCVPEQSTRNEKEANLCERRRYAVVKCAYVMALARKFLDCFQYQKRRREWTAKMHNFLFLWCVREEETCMHFFKNINKIENSKSESANSALIVKLISYFCIIHMCNIVFAACGWTRGAIE